MLAPLFTPSLMEGFAIIGAQKSFLYDIGAQVRLLVAHSKLRSDVEKADLVQAPAR
jgi:hypothetical protein